MTTLTGHIYSHTTIRVPGTAHADDGPFTLVLVDLDAGSRVLGRFDGTNAAIGAAVVGNDDDVPTFRPVEEQ